VTTRQTEIWELVGSDAMKGRDLSVRVGNARRSELAHRHESTSNGELVLLLSIQSPHAERIFSGSKHFELRKALPRRPIRRVYLYVTGGVGVVGCFDVADVLRHPVAQLWRLVGLGATTRERFFRYFADAQEGCAIEIRNPLRFDLPVPLRVLQLDNPSLIAPQSYLVLGRGHAILGLLETKRREAMRTQPPSVHLREIADEERGVFRKLVQKHIGANYDDIDDSFALRTLQVHDVGKDPAGFFTTRKEVLAVENLRGRCIGFTTLTYKSGAAVKTGPTVLLPAYRGKGYGQAMRRAIEERARAAGARKVYCTSPDTAIDTVRYLLASGMRVEAHLARHYSQSHDELVFGKLLVADAGPEDEVVTRSRRKGIIADPVAFRRKDLTSAFKEMFEQVWHPVTAAYAKRIVAEVLGRVRAPRANVLPAKPKAMVCAGSRGRCIAAVVLLPKRGGAVKGVLLRSTDHALTIEKLLKAATESAREAGHRKFYFLHPVDDFSAVRLFRGLGFTLEGLLRAPYVQGRDVVVAAKFL
jgi:predicted transcriptional regulator/GNAT superfamily N-acetyltransferase